jgi:hypothetical protein
VCLAVRIQLEPRAWGSNDANAAGLAGSCRADAALVGREKTLDAKEERNYEPVFLSLLLDIADFLGDLLQEILVVRILSLEFCMASANYSWTEASNAGSLTLLLPRGSSL